MSDYFYTLPSLPVTPLFTFFPNIVDIFANNNQVSLWLNS